MDVWSRAGLGVVWVVVAWLAFRGERSRGAIICGVAALALALAAAVRWHVALLHAARSVLRDTGLYEERMIGKIVIVIGVLVALSLAARWIVLLPPGLRGALLAVMGFAAYLAAYTVFLDGVLPAALGRAPGRQLVELAFAVPAVVSLSRWRRSDARAG